MQLSLSQWTVHLQKPLAPLYVITGDEILLVQEALDELRQAARQKDYAERHSFTALGAHFDWSPVLQAAGSLSLFADKQIVEIHIPSGKPGKDGSAHLQNIAHLAFGQDSTLFIVVLPSLDRTSQQSSWFSALEQTGVVLTVQNIEAAQMGKWIIDRLAVNQQQLPQGDEGKQALQLLTQRVEGNLLAAYQEVQKLSLLYPKGIINLENLERAVTDVARYDVFKLGQSVWSGQLEKAHRMLEGLHSEGVAAVLVHYTLSEDLRALYRVQLGVQKGKALPVVLKEERIWGPKERLFQQAIPKWSLEQLRHSLQAAHILDGIIKGLPHPEWPVDPWSALLHWVRSLAK